MKKSNLTTLLFLSVFIIFSKTSFCQQAISIDIQNQVKNKKAEIINRDVSLINEKSYRGIRLSQDYEDGIVWFKGIEFGEGVLEFDTRGNDIQKHSFVGIAFHGADTTTFESIYLRPFNFKAGYEPQQSRLIQYIARPKYTWQVLREKFPGKYESGIANPPGPDSWVHVRVVVRDTAISVFINGASDASLVVKSLGQNKKGTVGFYVADTSGGDFANLKITKTE